MLDLCSSLVREGTGRPPNGRDSSLCATVVFSVVETYGSCVLTSELEPWVLYRAERGMEDESLECGVTVVG